jgi:hypothetical protein
MTHKRSSPPKLWKEHTERFSYLHKGSMSAEGPSGQLAKTSHPLEVPAGSQQRRVECAAGLASSQIEGNILEKLL